MVAAAAVVAVPGPRQATQCTGGILNLCFALSQVTHTVCGTFDDVESCTGHVSRREQHYIICLATVAAAEILGAAALANAFDSVTA